MVACTGHGWNLLRNALLTNVQISDAHKYLVCPTHFRGETRDDIKDIHGQLKSLSAEGDPLKSHKLPHKKIARHRGIKLMGNMQCKLCSETERKGVIF